jgi:hypothetical protein
MSSRHLLFVAAVGLFSAAQADTIYVDDDADPGGNGASWGMAYKYLQDALVSAGDGTVIHVAQGIYTPDQDEAGNVTPGDRTATFGLINGVALMGGYAGIGMPDPDDHDPDLYEAVLSGDLLGDDGPGFENNDENSYHVVTGSGSLDSLLSGFVIAAGNADGDEPHWAGGGLLNNDVGALTVDRCVFRDNWGATGGTTAVSS